MVERSWEKYLGFLKKKIKEVFLQAAFETKPDKLPKGWAASKAEWEEKQAKNA